MHRHCQYKFGISIPKVVEISPRLYIGHFEGIVLSGRAKIDSKRNLGQGVTIGKNRRGKWQGYPTSGDNIYIGTRAKMIGNIKIVNHVTIGAICVIMDDVPDNTVMIGILGKVISTKGTEDLLQYIWQDTIIN